MILLKLLDITLASIFLWNLVGIFWDEHQEKMRNEASKKFVEDIVKKADGQ